MIVPLGHTGPHLGHPVTPGEVARPQCPGHQGAPSKAPGRVTVQAALAVVYFSCKKFFSSVQSLSRVQLFATPWTAAHQSSLSITNSQSLLKLMSIKSVMPFNHLILSSPSPPAFNLSQHQGLFQGVSSSHQVAKILEFPLQHQSFQKHISYIIGLFQQ